MLCYFYCRGIKGIVRAKKGYITTCLAFVDLLQVDLNCGGKKVVLAIPLLLQYQYNSSRLVASLYGTCSHRGIGPPTYYHTIRTFVSVSKPLALISQPYLCHLGHQFSCLYMLHINWAHVWNIFSFFSLHAYRYKWVSVHGTKYKVGCILQIGSDEYDVPVFGKVVKICTINWNISDVIFLLSQLHTIEFNAHYQSYEVSSAPRQLVLFHQSYLNCFLPLNKTKPYGVRTKNSYIVPKFEMATNN